MTVQRREYAVCWQFPDGTTHIAEFGSEATDHRRAMLALASRRDRVGSHLVTRTVTVSEWQPAPLLPQPRERLAYTTRTGAAVTSIKPGTARRLGLRAARPQPRPRRLSFAERQDAFAESWAQVVVLLQGGVQQPEREAGSDAPRCGASDWRSEP